MVSTVDPCQSKPEEEPVRPRQAVAAESGRPAEIFQGKPVSSGGSSGKWWLIGIGACAFLIWIGSSGNKDSPQNSFAAQAPATTSSNRTASGADHERGVSVETPKPAADTEEIPPVGNGLVLGRSQIRYCLAEDIRMSAWQTQVDNYSSSSVDAFNRAVNDYNSRCSNFRYRSGTLENVRTQVEAERSRLVRQGLAMASANP
jgi:hypothetical protein